MNGSVYHNVGPLYANNHETFTPKFLQLYFLDGEDREAAINNNILQLTNFQIHLVEEIIEVIKENKNFYNTLLPIYNQFHHHNALPIYSVKIVDRKMLDVDETRLKEHLIVDLIV